LYLPLKFPDNFTVSCNYLPILGVPASQSACYGLRYRFGAIRTMRASTHALRMPNAYACAYMYAHISA